MRDSSKMYSHLINKGSCGVGLIASIQQISSHKILQQSLIILQNLEHRGATGQDILSGDGAGLMVDIPDSFFRSFWNKKNIQLPNFGDYAVGMFFFSKDVSQRKNQQKKIEKIIKENHFQFIGWREVPVNNSSLSPNDLHLEPSIYQLFISSSEQKFLNQQVYRLRKKIKEIIIDNLFEVVSFSNQTIVYKGLFLANQLSQYFLDFQQKKFKTTFCLVHQRYSTNTLPSWKLAHPMRFIAHNGEINTIIGNINSCNARAIQMKSQYFENLEELLPIIEENCSDSLGYDNFLEFLLQNNVSILEAIMMMMPQPWENETQMRKELKSFYRYHAPMLEAWDGPASIVFADKDFIGAAVDRNGLRPLRYYETADYLVIASEAGVLPFDDIQVLKKGKLGAGEIFALDRKQKELLQDESIKSYYSNLFPYEKWNSNKNFIISQSKNLLAKRSLVVEDLRLQQKIFSYSEEDLHMLLKSMAENAEELVYAMGTDTPIAILSEKPQLLYNYFQQRFAQVTNPPIDPIREQCNMSLESYIIHDFNLLEKKESNARFITFKNPILTEQEFLLLKEQEEFSYQIISILYEPKKTTLKETLDTICQQALQVVQSGKSFIILSDRFASEVKVPIPALLASSAIHHYLISKKQRRKFGLIIESAEPRETHHFALLLGYGATAIYPYLSLDSIQGIFEENQLKISTSQAIENYRSALSKGLKKIMSKMGISTLNSYQGAQIFEAVGLSKNFILEYFCGTCSSIGGIGIDFVEKELLLRHKQAFLECKLLSKGDYNWRVSGEKHLYNPKTIHLLQQASWKNDYNIYKEFSDSVNNEFFIKIRSLLDIDSDLKPIDLEETESEAQIVKRFCTGAMSIGAISRESHEDLAIAMNRIGAKSNTGEGGEDFARYKKEPNGDSKNSKIKQVASGRFGVTSYYLNHAQEIQIKISQGAKPGEGGQIKGMKVDSYIAKLRYTVKNVPLISPPPHHDIYSIEDLAQLIYDLKNANPNAEVSVKLVASQGVGTVAAGVVKGKADRIVIAGFEGGTGASPASSIKHAGIPWELGIAETQQMLVESHIRDRVILQIDGQITTGKDIIIGALLGAEEFGISTASLVTQGCILMRKCHLNTCPVGIATQDENLRKKYKGKPEYVVNYFMMIAREVREIMAQLGIRKFQDLIGQVQFLKVNQKRHSLKSKTLDFSFLLKKVKKKNAVYRQIRKQDNILDGILDKKLIQMAKPALISQEKVCFSMNIRNTQRTIGTMLGHKVTQKYGVQGLPEDTICINFFGTAGQSLGAFLPSGISLRLKGDANDYLGKGLCGGKIIVSASNHLKASENTIVGNTALYGATSGKVFLNGKTGERFAVRNSGALAVVEGVGEHGCEYMTGGLVLVLGKIGRNFGAGMSGGRVYVYGHYQDIEENCNLDSVEVFSLQEDKEIWPLLEEYFLETNSEIARKILDNKKLESKKFSLILPRLSSEAIKQKAS